MLRLIALILIALSCGCGAVVRGGRFVDDFSSYRSGFCLRDGERIGPWLVVSTGFGCVEAAGREEGRWLQAKSVRSLSPLETHAILVTGPRFRAPF
ncbi:MAG: hypothetical protein HYZ74_06545 [Elusimicrobia bacterium]|nr:hypothetical protein [Elusimicrobiota bacterium]